MLSVDRMFQILQHPLIHPVGAARYGIHKPSPPSHSGQLMYIHAFFLKRFKDQPLPVTKLVKYMAEPA